MNSIEVKNLINELKNDIQSVVESINDDQNNVFEHIRKSSLLSKIKRLNKIDSALNIEKYKIVFVGTIGAGKTTAICHLFNLVDEVPKAIKSNKKTKNIEVITPLFSTGSGRTTISEVIIQPDDNVAIKIEPYSQKKLEQLINEFCESFYSENPEDDLISIEIERALRSIINLKKITKQTKIANGKTRSKTIDQAKEKAKEVTVEEFKNFAFENAKLESRYYTKEESEIFCPKSENPKVWLRKTFAEVNKAEIAEFSLPKKIYVYVNSEVYGDSELSKFDSIIDTKGIDENPIRPDLNDYINQDDTICLFTSSYNDAPETNVRELMKYSLTQHSKNYEKRFVTFVMPHKGEPEQENDGDGSYESGTEIKKAIVQGVFDGLKIKFLNDNIIFYDALQFYDTEGRLNRDYDSEDIQEIKNDTIFAIDYVIENRKQSLKDEIKKIEESFKLIQTGKTLSDSEVQLINSTISDIKDISNLDKRIPSFTYEEFIDDYIEYYSTTYKAWNTKDAIHRRLGTFEERGFDTYFDAKIIAEGRAEDEMLRKFTHELYNEVVDHITKLGISLKDLDTLTPEIVKRFEIQYDNFISSVGVQLEQFLRTNNNNVDFWRELINRRGKGAGYNQDVCTMLRRKLGILNTGISVERVLQEFSEKEWKKLIEEILKFFKSN